MTTETDDSADARYRRVEEVTDERIQKNEAFLLAPHETDELGIMLDTTVTPTEKENKTLTLVVPDDYSLPTYKAFNDNLRRYKCVEYNAGFQPHTIGWFFVVGTDATPQGEYNRKADAICIPTGYMLTDTDNDGLNIKYSILGESTHMAGGRHTPRTPRE